jgi:hypothetical protein
MVLLYQRTTQGQERIMHMLLFRNARCCLASYEGMTMQADDWARPQT